MDAVSFLLCASFVKNGYSEMSFTILFILLLNCNFCFICMFFYKL
uniref:Uncharacterized protein n=1 Tax=Arundo donax TaxID=35708 RepID=A0A0A9BN96_ARUDO